MLTAMNEDGSQMEESIRVHFLGKQHITGQLHTLFCTGGWSITFVGNTPSVDESSIEVKFSVSGSINVVMCCLLPKPQSGNNCVKC